MRFERNWQIGPDGRLRPVIIALLADAAGERHQVSFLVDTGADVTVFTGEILALLRFSASEADGPRLAGTGGATVSTVVNTNFRLRRENGEWVRFNGPLQAFSDPERLEMCVMGRDYLNHFAVIVDRKHDRVCLLTGRHHYSIQET